MRKCEDGWADPDCGLCDGYGWVGYGSEQEACECFIDSRDVLAARDHCPPMVDA